MQNFTIGKIIQQLFILITLFLILYILIREYKTLKYQKRFARFSLLSMKEQEISFFDTIKDSIWILLHKGRKWLRNNELLQAYSEKYEQRLSESEKKRKSGLDFILIKFFVAFFFVFLNLITIVFHFYFLGIFSCVISFFLGFFLPDIFWKVRWQKDQKKIEDEFLTSIIIMNHSFKSGRNIMQAIEDVKNTLEGPLKEEFHKMYLDLNYGLSMEVVFERFYERIKLTDAKYISTSLTLLNQTGGNITTIFSEIEKNIYQKKQLQKEKDSLLATSRYTFYITSFLPLAFVGMIEIITPHYFSPFFSSPYGFLLFLFLLFLYLCYILVINHLLKGNIQ